MSNKGNSRHVKRLAASKFAGIPRKASKYFVKQRPGRHTLDTSTPLLSLIRDVLSYASDANEAEFAIRKGYIELNGKVEKDPKQAVGYGDILHIIPNDEYFAVKVDKQGSIALEKADKNAKRIGKIVRKYMGKKGKQYIQLHDGSVFEAPEGAKVNDSVVIGNGKPEKVIKLEVGTTCTVYKGRHTSETGKVKSIIKKGRSKATVEIETQNGTIQTLLENVIAIGE